MDNSGTTAAAEVRCRLDKHERTERGDVASGFDPDPAARAHALVAKLREARNVRRRKSPDDDVRDRQHREHVKPYDFAKAPFHAIPVDGRM